MRGSRGLITFLIGTLLPCSLSAQDIVPSWEGEWIDGNGSVLKLELMGDDVKGVYDPGLVSPDCIGGTNPVVGVVYGDQIVISIVFEKCPVTLAFLGQHTDYGSTERIEGSWITNLNVEDQFEKQALWATFNFGVSYFSPK